MKRMVSIVLLVLASGCATTNGIEMTEAEAAACKRETCSVWTLNELRALIAKVFRDGWDAAAKQSGKPI